MFDSAIVETLHEWESFYVIVGSAAAALTGLMFVVIVLTAEMRISSGTGAVRAFGTPNVVHFTAVLLLSAVMSMPRMTESALKLAVSAGGAAGLLLTGYVLWIARHQTGYRPELSDWIWHALLPFVSYLLLLAAGVTFGAHPEESLYGIALCALFILIIGIHNAWDSAVYLAARHRQQDRERDHDHRDPP